MKESIYIRVNNQSLNRNTGKYCLPHIWDELLFNITELKIITTKDSSPSGYSICHNGNNIFCIKTFHPVWLFHQPQWQQDVPSHNVSIPPATTGNQQMPSHIGKNIYQPFIKGYNTLKWFSICHTWTESNGTTSAITNWQNIFQTVVAITSAIIKINHVKYFIVIQL